MVIWYREEYGRLGAANIDDKFKKYKLRCMLMQKKKQKCLDREIGCNSVND